jgi:hypothetical protein
MSYAWAVLSVPIEQLERQDQALINCLLAAPGFLTGRGGHQCFEASGLPDRFNPTLDQHRSPSLTS